MRRERTSLAVRISLTVGILGVVLGVGVGRMNGTPEAIIAEERPPSASPTPAETEPPQIEVASRTRGLHPYRPLRLKGTVSDGSLKIDGRKVALKNGRFAIKLPKPPGSARLVAVDDSGNRTETVVTFKTKPFSIRGIHVSAYAWATPSFRESILRAVKRGLINTVELDLKDESGVVGYASKVPLAKRIGSVGAIYDLRDAVRRLHRAGARVIGRLVAFRDPILARASWNRGHKRRVIQTPDRKPYANYGGFTNFADKTVRRYNQDIAEEAARLGVDDVLYDYVRRPDGPLKNLRIPGLETSPEKAIATFVGETTRRLRPLGVKVGASVYGIAATRPKEIAQSIPRIARVADYVAPMLYPSHWAPGEYNVRHPNSSPYKIVKRSLKDFLKQTKGTGAEVVPWLQDFSLGVAYGPAQVKAQIQGAKDAGVKQWLLWDPHVTYSTQALIR